RDVAVADRRAVGDPGELRPDRELERRAARGERQVELPARRREVLGQLVGRGREQALPARPLRPDGSGALPGVQQVEPAERPLVPGQQDPPGRRVHDVVPGRGGWVGGQERIRDHVIPHFRVSASGTGVAGRAVPLASAVRLSGSAVPPRSSAVSLAAPWLPTLPTPTVRAGTASSVAHRWCTAYERHGRQRSAAPSGTGCGPPFAPAVSRRSARASPASPGRNTSGSDSARILM